MKKKREKETVVRKVREFNDRSKVVMFMREFTKWFLIFVILTVAGFLIWANYIHFKTCEDEICFNDYMESCARASFISGEEMLFEYQIMGISGEKCVVDVRMIEGDLSNKDSVRLEEKMMRCDLDLGVVSVPEANIENCHGLLKEGLQDLIINKLHRYIVQNLGEGEELNLGV